MPGRGLCMGLDCGFRRNDGGVGAVNRAPTQKPTLVSLALPRPDGGGDRLYRLPGLRPLRWGTACRAPTRLAAEEEALGGGG